MPTTSRPENEIIRLFVSAYECGAWENAAVTFPDETSDRGIDGLATKPNGEALAMEHTVVEPFIGDITDQSEFIPEFSPVEKDETLRVPNTWIQVFVPVGTLHLQKGPVRDAILKAVEDWIRVHGPSLPKGDSQRRCSVQGVSGNSGFDIVLTLKVTDLPGEGSVHIRRQQVADTFGEVIERMLGKKLPKLVATDSTKRILLLERRHMNLYPDRIMSEIELCRTSFASLAKVHEIWIVENIPFFGENRYIRFERYKGAEVIDAFDFYDGRLFTRRENDRTVLVNGIA